MDIRIAAYGVIIRDGQILLSHWNEHGRSGWTLPGGGIEGAEHPVLAAKREIFEETGYEASVDRLLGIDTMVVPAAKRHSGTVPLYAMRVVYRATRARRRAPQRGRRVERRGAVVPARRGAAA